MNSNFRTKQDSYNNLDSHPEYSVVGSSSNLFDNKGVLGKDIFEGEITKIKLLISSTLIHPTIMMYRETLISVSGYSIETEFERVEDFDLWCKYLENGYKLYILDVILLDYCESNDLYKKRKYKYRFSEFKLRKR